MPNELMREMWTKHGGPAWVADRELFESVYAPFNDALVAALDPVDGLSVLDVGCGVGSLSRLVLDHGGIPVGVDISETMIEGAREFVPGARFEVADAQIDRLRDLVPPGTGDGFDRVTSRFGVMFFDDAVAAFENIRTATKPDARMAFACWRSLAENPTFSLGTDVLVDRMPEPPPAAPSGAPGPVAFEDPEVVRAILDESGWSNISIEPLDATCDYGTDGSDGVERRIRMILTGQSGRLAEQQLRPALGEQAWSALLDEVRAVVRASIVDGAVRFPGRTWLVTAAG